MAKSTGKTNRRPGASAAAAGGGQTAERISRVGEHRAANTAHSLASLAGRSPSAVRKWADRSE